MRRKIPYILKRKCQEVSCAAFFFKKVQIRRGKAETCRICQTGENRKARKKI